MTAVCFRCRTRAPIRPGAALINDRSLVVPHVNEIGQPCIEYMNLPMVNPVKTLDDDEMWSLP